MHDHKTHCNESRERANSYQKHGLTLLLVELVQNKPYTFVQSSPKHDLHNTVFRCEHKFPGGLSFRCLLLAQLTNHIPHNDKQDNWDAMIYSRHGDIDCFQLVHYIHRIDRQIKGKTRFCNRAWDDRGKKERKEKREKKVVGVENSKHSYKPSPPK